MLADPKALQYVLQTSGYRFPKRADARAHQRMRAGDGMVWAHGELAIESHQWKATTDDGANRRTTSTAEEDHEPCVLRAAAQVIRPTLHTLLSKGCAPSFRSWR